MALQEEHHLFDLPLLGPGARDQLDAHPADAQHLVQPAWLLLDDAQRLQPEFAHDTLGRHGADALDQAAAQVLFQPGDGGRQHRAHLVGLELAAVLRVSDPRARQQHRLAHVEAQHVADHGHRVTGAVWRQLSHGVAVFLVMIGDALDDPAQCVRRQGLAPSWRIVPERAAHASARTTHPNWTDCHALRSHKYGIIPLWIGYPAEGSCELFNQGGSDD